MDPDFFKKTYPRLTSDWKEDDNAQRSEQFAIVADKAGNSLFEERSPLRTRCACVRQCSVYIVARARVASVAAISLAAASLHTFLTSAASGLLVALTTAAESYHNKPAAALFSFSVANYGRIPQP